MRTIRISPAKITLLIAVLFCCLIAVADAKPAKAMKVDVMTFNIRYGSAKDGENHWSKRKQMVFDVIAEHKCDVVGMQEALGFQIREILEDQPQYGLIGVAREDGEDDGEYSPILYNRERFKVEGSGTFWLSDTPDVAGSTHWGNACVRICSWARLVDKKTSGAFYMFNLHLDHISQPSREKSVVLLAKRIAEREHDDPFVVTGDFNAGESNPAIGYLKGKVAVDGLAGGKSENPAAMVDTFRVVHPEAADTGTFNGFKGVRTGEKIDFIFTTSDVKVLKAAILYDNTEGRYPSDHFPLSARLRLPAKAAR